MCVHGGGVFAAITIGSSDNAHRLTLHHHCGQLFLIGSCRHRLNLRQLGSYNGKLFFELSFSLLPVLLLLCSCSLSGLDLDICLGELLFVFLRIPLVP